MIGEKIIQAQLKKALVPIKKELKREMKKQNALALEKQEAPIANKPVHFAVPTGVGLINDNGNMRKWGKQVDFGMLRSLSENYDVARACINRRKRQVECTNWFVAPTDKNEKESQYKKQIEVIESFFKSPSGLYSDFREFVNELVEDILVMDAGCLWKDKTKGNKITKLLIVDGETIRLRINTDGSTPEAPDPAYEQYVGGEVRARFTTEEMIYVMLNPRSKTPYGLAPLESLIIAVDGALRSQLYNVSLMSEGNVPEGFLSMPPDWTPEQIKEYQMFLDAMVSGNPRFQSRIKLIPGGQGVGYIQAKKPEDMRFLEFEKWMLYKTCAIFDVPPEEIGITESVNRASAIVQHDVANKAGLQPMLKVLKGVFDRIIKEDFGIPELSFYWEETDTADTLKEAQELAILVPIGAKGIDEWRQEHALEPLGLEPYIMTPNGPVFVKELLSNPLTINQAPQGNTEPNKDEETTPKGNNQQNIEEKPDKTENLPEDKSEKMIDDLGKWKHKALKDAKDGKQFRKFESDNISNIVKRLIETSLMLTKDKEKVRKVFDDQIQIVK